MLMCWHFSALQALNTLQKAHIIEKHPRLFLDHARYAEDLDVFGLSLIVD